MPAAVALLALSAYNPSPYGSCPTGELDGAAVRDHGVRVIDPINWRSSCFIYTFPTPNHPKFDVLSTADAFQNYVDMRWDQSVGNEPPTVDWETEEVVGIGVSVDCPGTRVVSSDFLDCETGFLVVDVDWEQNWYQCDFGSALVASYIVPKGFVQSMELYNHELSVCEDVTCDCWDGKPVQRLRRLSAHKLVCSTACVRARRADGLGPRLVPV